MPTIEFPDLAVVDTRTSPEQAVLDAFRAVFGSGHVQESIQATCTWVRSNWTPTIYPTSRRKRLVRRVLHAHGVAVYPPVG